MTDYERYSLDGWTVTLRVPQFARLTERGRWAYATCGRCGAREDIGRDESADALLHRLTDHRCTGPGKV